MSEIQLSGVFIVENSHHYFFDGGPDAGLNIADRDGDGLISTAEGDSVHVRQESCFIGNFESHSNESKSRLNGFYLPTFLCKAIDVLQDIFGIDVKLGQTIWGREINEKEYELYGPAASQAIEQFRIDLPGMIQNAKIDSLGRSEIAQKGAIMMYKGGSAIETDNVRIDDCDGDGRTDSLWFRTSHGLDVTISVDAHAKKLRQYDSLGNSLLQVFPNPNRAAVEEYLKPFDELW